MLRRCYTRWLKFIFSWNCGQGHNEIRGSRLSGVFLTWFDPISIIGTVARAKGWQSALKTLDRSFKHFSVWILSLRHCLQTLLKIADQHIWSILSETGYVWEDHLCRMWLLTARHRLDWYQTGLFLSSPKSLSSLSKFLANVTTSIDCI